MVSQASARCGGRHPRAPAATGKIPVRVVEAQVRVVEAQVRVVEAQVRVAVSPPRAAMVPVGDVAGQSGLGSPAAGGAQ